MKAEIAVKEADRKDREVEKCQSYLNKQLRNVDKLNAKLRDVELRRALEIITNECLEAQEAENQRAKEAAFNELADRLNQTISDLTKEREHLTTFVTQLNGEIAGL